MNSFQQISETLSEQTPEWALKIAQKMVSEWKEVGNSYKLPVSLPPFVICLEINTEETTEIDEDTVAIAVMPKEPYYIEFPNGDLNLEAVDDDFLPYSKELWRPIIKDVIKKPSVIGFLFVCESLTSIEGQKSDAIIACYQGFGGVSSAYVLPFKEQNGEVSFASISPISSNPEMSLNLSGLYDSRFDKETIN